MPQKTKTSISFNVPEKLWNAFKTQTDNLFLTRSTFLDHVIANELQYLRSDLRGLRQSHKAKRHVANAMRDKVSVNIEVHTKTAEDLRDAMQVHNVVRDAFIARLLVLLRSTDGFLKHLNLHTVATCNGPGWSLEEMPSSPMKAMEAIRDDPLFYVRHHVEQVHQVGLYRVRFDPSLDWAACYLDDEQVTGTAAHRKQKNIEKTLAELLDIQTKGKK